MPSRLRTSAPLLAPLAKLLLSGTVTGTGTTAQTMHIQDALSAQYPIELWGTIALSPFQFHCGTTHAAFSQPGMILPTALPTCTASFPWCSMDICLSVSHSYGALYVRQVQHSLGSMTRPVAFVPVILPEKNASGAFH
jgi:hypothetical protein